MLLQVRAISICLWVVFCSASFAQAQQGLTEDEVWNRYKSEFIQSDGRIIDKKQSGISHSEGQGYGMLLSVLYNDRPVFDNLWNWTRNNIQVRRDGLFAWSWGKRHNEQWGVIDHNNATDGDLLIAYALVKAASKWSNAEYKTNALKIIESLRSQLVIKWQDRSFLLPADYGFFKQDRIVLNPSYLVFPAFRAFSEIDDKGFWQKIYSDSLFLLSKSIFGKLRLPADWVVINSSGIALYADKSPYYGYEAIRTLLYLSWDKGPEFPKGTEEMFNVFRKDGYIPLFVDLAKDAVSLDSASAGFYAVYAAVADKKGDKTFSRQLFKEAARKIALEKDNYYSMSLFLLASRNPEP